MARIALLGTFSIDFVGPLPTGINGEKHLLIAEENITDLPALRCTKNDMSDVVSDFVKEEKIFTFRPRKTIISNNASCFKTEILQEMIIQYRIKWKTVCSYALMSNGRAERMVGAIKQAKMKTAQNDNIEGPEVVIDVHFGYFRDTPQFSGTGPVSLFDDPYIDGTDSVKHLLFSM